LNLINFTNSLQGKKRRKANIENFMDALSRTNMRDSLITIGVKDLSTQPSFYKAVTSEALKAKIKELYDLDFISDYE